MQYIYEKEPLKLSNTNYKVTIHTADEYLAGTDSNIFLTLYGPLGESNEVRLNGKIKGNAFERNDIDRVTIEVPQSLGDIYKVDVRSDCMYAGSGWRLDYIQVQRQKTSEDKAEPPTAHFACKEWIENKKVHTYKVTSGLPVSSVPEDTMESYDSGARIYVPAHQSLTYTDTLSVEVGYALSETTAFKISTNTQLSIQGGFGPGGSNADAKVGSLTAALQFALSTENSKSTEISQNQTHTRTVKCEVTLKNDTDEEKVYAVYLSRKKRVHTITMGDYCFKLPEYLNERFDGVRELKPATA